MQKVVIEVAVLTLSAKEHADLHTDPKGFINTNGVFCKDVRSVVLADHPKKPHTKDEIYIVTMSHWPDCNAVGSCQ